PVPGLLNFFGGLSTGQICRDEKQVNDSAQSHRIIYARLSCELQYRRCGYVNGRRGHRPGSTQTHTRGDWPYKATTRSCGSWIAGNAAFRYVPVPALQECAFDEDRLRAG